MNEWPNKAILVTVCTINLLRYFCFTDEEPEAQGGSVNCLSTNIDGIEAVRVGTELNTHSSCSTL